MKSDAIDSHTPHSACDTVLTSQAMRERVTVDGQMVLPTAMPDRHCHTVSCSTTTVLLQRLLSCSFTLSTLLQRPLHR